MRKFFTIKQLIMILIMVAGIPFTSFTQVELPRDNWTASAYRFAGWGFPAAAIDGDMTTGWDCQGLANTGRWFKIDLGDTLEVVKIVISHGAGFPAEIDFYVTNFEYPFAAAQEAGSGNSGDLFIRDEENITFSLRGNSEPLVEVSFDAAEGRYIWIVSNSDPGGEWWVIRDIKVFAPEEETDPDPEPEEHYPLDRSSWEAYAFRYADWGPPSRAIDGNWNTEFNLRGQAQVGRWFMVDMGVSQQVNKVELWFTGSGLNFLSGFDVYVTDSVYDIAAASGPGEAPSGQFFIADPDNITASITGNTEPSVGLSFPSAKGRYIWIVVNEQVDDWWTMHEFLAYGPEPTGVAPMHPVGFSNGLVGMYWNNRDLIGPREIVRIDAQLNFNWPNDPVAGKPAPEINDNDFSIRWKGYIRPAFSESYTFKFDHNDGARFVFNGDTVIDNWMEGRVTDEFTLELDAWEMYPIVIELFEGMGSSQAILSWVSASQAEQVIPAASYFHTPMDFIYQIFDPTNVEQLQAGRLTVYPNPLNRGNKLQVQVEKEGSELTVYDMTGRLVLRQPHMQQGLNSIELNLNPGAYILRVEGNQTKLIVR